MKRVAVLGAGLVGGLIAKDLARDGNLRVTVADRSETALGRVATFPRIETRRAELSRPDEVRSLAREADVVAVAVPGYLGTATLQAVLETGRPLVDISFSPEDPFVLDGAAKAAGVPAVVDCGVAPGLSNLLVGRAVGEMDRLERALILVGGLPVRRTWPYEYRLVFSLTDVLEEYTRPSRFREHGIEVVRPALSEIEPVDLPRAGTLEAFNTDGLRTLLRTVDAPDLKEKTLRWPGHAERMRLLRETGFLGHDPVDAGGVLVRPRALTEALLTRAWALPEGEDEFTVLRVEVEGRKAGRRTRITWDLYDRTDPVTRDTSMSRTTGFPCAIVARILAEGGWSRPGVHPPEFLGKDAAIATRILDDLGERGVSVERHETPLAER